MRILLLLLLLFCQDTTDKLIQDLKNDDPVIREAATNKLMTREQDLSIYKSFEASDPETKWRLGKVIQVIEANQKFRSMSTVSPLVTLKFSGEIKDLFAKLAEITGQKFDVRAFGDNKVTIDCVDTPLFQVLDETCKQTAFDWEVVYRDTKGDVIRTVYGDRSIWSPNTTYTTVIELTGVGMSSKTLNSVVPGFKLQVTQTSLSVNNTFNGVNTSAMVQFKCAAEPSLRFVSGPKLDYTKIVTNEGVELINTSTEALYAIVRPPPTTKSISLKGKATYRFPMRVETIVLDVTPIINVARDANGDKYMGFAEYPNIMAKMTSNTFNIIMSGDDNHPKERFLNSYSIKGANGKVGISKAEQGDIGSYFSVYDDHLQFYMYANGTTFVPDTIEFQYVTELRDISFDFTINDIPLY